MYRMPKNKVDILEILHIDKSALIWYISIDDLLKGGCAMGKRVTLGDIANALHVSKATVSKAINNCPGVHSDTKRAIVETASGYGYALLKPPKNVATILPSAPVYFWGELRSRIVDYGKEAGIDIECYIYPNLYNGKDALRCIEQALEGEPSVLIVAAPDTEEIRAVLQAAASGVLIILVEEFLNIPNTFYIGTDSVAQGYHLTEKYIKAFPTSNDFAILDTTYFATEKERISGFLSALQSHGKRVVFRVGFDSQSRTQSATIARALSDAKALPDCVFCPSGGLAKAALAIKKLRSPKKIHCIGFDVNVNGLNHNDKSILTFVSVQDIDGQAKRAVVYAKNFLLGRELPEDKSVYIESKEYAFID